LRAINSEGSKKFLSQERVLQPFLFRTPFVVFAKYFWTAKKNRGKNLIIILII